jgi:hypothetical protein
MSKILIHVERLGSCLAIGQALSRTGSFWTQFEKRHFANLDKISFRVCHNENKQEPKCYKLSLP